ncbi:hypothetical protein [Singulisphaera acidiphila]|uniref:Uncharacterized protein n=1 Tax=Singulisphaera acidiphila (strain ATCC BAA-1392 / DSM 18658 / VKM B-2454 / MOB10) TaxID=886293 RepID=L0DRS4_SINAD|nr:hypothetical protein [Singulisphaera acidiphila]AGA31682.1 hypothetical protein Sinac_7652 [Singulisphaera acidiphila DSM 18658]
MRDRVCHPAKLVRAFHCSEIRQPKHRARRTPLKGESRGRKIGLPDGVHDRLWQEARRKKIIVSSLATDILNKNLPRFKIEQEG